MHFIEYVFPVCAFINILYSAPVSLKTQALKHNEDVELKNDLLKVLGINNASVTNGHEKWSSEYLESLYNTLTEIPSNVFKADVTIHGYRPLNSDSLYNDILTRQYKIAAEHLSDNFPNGQVELVFESCTQCAQSTISISVCWQEVCETNETLNFVTEGKFSILDVTMLFQMLQQNLISFTTTTFGSGTEDIFVKFSLLDDYSMLQESPVLVVHSIQKKKYTRLLKELHQRQKRQANAPIDPPYQVQEDSNPCMRKPWEVDFEELGWSEWIVQPKTFEAYICSGTCFTDDLQSNVTMSRHAFVRQLYLERELAPSLKKVNYIPKAQCVPIETEALHTLFTDNTGNLVLKRIDEIVAKTCGCL